MYQKDSQGFDVLRCDMREDCQAAVTHLDSSGFVYCAGHGVQRQQYERCRKLKPAEVKRLQSGQPLSRY